MLWWDISQVIMLMYVATMVPLRLGFAIPQPAPGGRNWWIELVSDVYFLVDFCMNFCAAYLDDDKNVVADRKSIASRYLRGWFFIDLVCRLVPFPSSLALERVPEAAKAGSTAHDAQIL